MCRQYAGLQSRMRASKSADNSQDDEELGNYAVPSTKLRPVGDMNVTQPPRVDSHIEAQVAYKEVHKSSTEAQKADVRRPSADLHRPDNEPHVRNDVNFNTNASNSNFNVNSSAYNNYNNSATNYNGPVTNSISGKMSQQQRVVEQPKLRTQKRTVAPQRHSGNFQQELYKLISPEEHLHPKYASSPEREYWCLTLTLQCVIGSVPSFNIYRKCS